MFGREIVTEVSPGEDELASINNHILTHTKVLNNRLSDTEGSC
jgi:hypothetical protein